MQQVNHDGVILFDKTPAEKAQKNIRKAERKRQQEFQEQVLKDIEELKQQVKTLTEIINGNNHS